MDLIFDRKELLSAFEGDEDVLIEIISDFKNDLIEHKKVINEGIQNNDFKAIEISTHTLKGLAGTFFSSQPSNLAYECEKLAKEQTLKKLKRTKISYFQVLMN